MALQRPTAPGPAAPPLLQLPEARHVTEEILREWRNPAPDSVSRAAQPVPMNRFLYELVWSMVRGDLPPQRCRSAIDSVEFANGQTKEDSASVLADIVAHLWQDLSIPGDLRSRLVKTAKILVESSLLCPRLLQERCEEDFLWESDLSKSRAQDLKAKEVRVNTRLLYQQTKFNLLREESEGYAKLATLLCHGGLDSLDHSTSTVTISIIKSLIGHFDLDPNRVFDIVLECFELYPDNGIFYHLIPIFPKSHADQILGFKFQYYQQLEVKAPVPVGLYRLAALLVKAEFIDLDSLYAHLLPVDEDAFQHYDAFLAKRIEEASKIGKVNLAATGKDLMDEEKQDLTVDLYTALDMEWNAVAERAAEIEKNQKLGLLLGFLSVEDWYHAHILFDRLAQLNPVEHVQISDGLFRIIEKAISSTYEVACQMYYETPRTYVGDAMDSTSSNLVALPREFFQMLTTAGPFLHRDTILLQKVCRVLRAHYVSVSESTCTSDSVNSSGMNENRKCKEAQLRIEEALSSCLLPSLQLVQANPAVGSEIWRVLTLLPYEVRYRLYGEWEKDDERNPVVLAARQIAKLDTRRLLKRLAKENLKQLGRMVAKLSHANPMTVLRTIVHQIEAYKDMITPVVDAFKYLTQLEYDMLQYIVIERLAQGGREKLKDDGLNLADWLQSLALFWGHLCKKHPLMELKSLFQYLVNQLKKGSGIELVMLEELIQQMANVQYTENMTEEQIDAMAGSETLRYQANLFCTSRSNKVLSKSINKLKESLLPKEEPKLAVPLLLLMAQHRSMIVINADAPHIKMVSEQFDRCHGALLQYVEFLSAAITPASTYAQLIPPLEELIHKYHLEPEVAFLIYRPIMRLFRSTSDGDICWPLDDLEEEECLTSNNDIVLDIGSSQKPIMWSDLLITMESILPTKAWNSLSPDLYATFWGLTLYDLYVPKDRYESELAKLHSSLKQSEENPDNSSIGITKRKKEKERIQEVLDKLTNELHKHEQHVASVLQRLNREKDKWWSSCLDALKINIEFLQRCILPRCVFSMQDAVYCAKFVYMLHSLGTPFFNTVNHIDVFICKTIQPLICSCTEFEAGRLGRFLYDTLKMAYDWKNDESLYDRECGNMPGFAMYYRDPNRARVTYKQFLRVHWKWSTKLTKALVYCLESKEYMEIRNALIVLTKVSSVFPVLRKSGINVEKRVVKIKVDEREDLKVLATGVAATLAARKNSWVSDEEFGIDLKPAASPAKYPPGNQLAETLLSKEQIARAKSGDNKVDKADGSNLMRHDVVQHKIADDSTRLPDDELSSKVSPKPTLESEIKQLHKRSLHSSSGKVLKQDQGKDDVRFAKSVSRTVSQSYAPEGLQDPSAISMPAAGNGSSVAASVKASTTQRQSASGASAVAKTDMGQVQLSGNLIDTTDSLKQTRRSTTAEESERLVKRRKAGVEGEHADHKMQDKERIVDQWSTGRTNLSDIDHSLSDELNSVRQDNLKSRPADGHERETREKLERLDRNRGEDMSDKASDRRVRSSESSQERGLDRPADKARDERNKDERSKPTKPVETADRGFPDERFRGQSLPPPPPLPTSFVPQSVGGNSRKEEEAERKIGSNRHVQRLSPRHDEKEKRHSEENALALQDDARRRREDDFKDRKHSDRERIEERDRDKLNTSKGDNDSIVSTKRRKVRRDQLSSVEGIEYSPNATPSHLQDEAPKAHFKEAASKTHRRDVDLLHEKEWDEDKRQRAEVKRKYRK